jgi:16S rRNA processing protein RimM
VVVELWSDQVQRLAPGSVLSSSGGPLTVERSRLLRPGRYVVAFAGVGDRSAAEQLRGWELQAPQLDEGEAPGTLWVHELVGAMVRDAAGTELGRVTAVEANPASDLLVLESGGLIPVRFVTALDSSARTVEVDVPPGLLEP